MRNSITRLLRDWRQGNEAALGEVAGIVDRELRRIAASYMSRERSGHTLQPTALVNEAYLRLMSQNRQVDWQSRSHFIAIAAQHMRQILVDHARRQAARKRGAGVAMISLDNDDAPAESPSEDLLALDEALDELAKVDPRKARAMEMKFFGGMKMAEIANVLNVSVKTIEKDVRVAGAWLRTALGE